MDVPVPVCSLLGVTTTGGAQTGAFTVGRRRTRVVACDAEVRVQRWRPMVRAGSDGAVLSRAESTAASVAAVGVAGFGVFGYMTGAPSTTGYLISVTAVAVGVGLSRRRPLPGWLAGTLAVLALGHMAGGLVTVGGDVLYNAHPTIRVLQYDHVFHATASSVAAVVVWLYVSEELTSRAGAMVVAVLGGLGVGALNELVEFLATLAHHGTHVGGYRNTGWDLLSNAVGATSATVVMAWMTRHRSRG